MISRSELTLELNPSRFSRFRARCSSGVYFGVATALVCSAKTLQLLWIIHPNIRLAPSLIIVRNQFADVGASMIFACISFAVLQRRWQAIAITLLVLNLYEFNQAVLRPVFGFDWGDSFAYVVGLVFFGIFDVRSFPISLTGRKFFGR